MRTKIYYSVIIVLLVFSFYSCQKKPPTFPLKTFGFDSLVNPASKEASNFANPGMVELGTGYNSATGEFAALHVAQDSLTTTDSTGGDQAESFQATLISSQSDLRNSLNMGFNASGGFGPFSASAKADFLNESQITSTSDYLLVRVKVKSYSVQFVNPRLSDEAKSRVNPPGSAERFFKFAGDEYVFEKIYGGELYILFSAESQSNMEKRQNSQSFKAAVRIFSAGGKREELSQSFNSIKRLSITICRSGSRDNGISRSTSVDSVFDAAANFHKEVRLHPALVAVNTKPIYHLRGYPINQMETDILQQKFFLNDVVRKEWEIQDLLATVRYAALADRTIFPDSIRDQAGKIRRDLETRIVNLRRCKQVCEINFRKNDCLKCPELTNPLPPFLAVLHDSL